MSDAFQINFDMQEVLTSNLEPCKTVLSLKEALKMCKNILQNWLKLPKHNFFEIE